VESVVAVVPTLGHDLSRLDAAIASVHEHTRHPRLTIVVVNNSAEPLPHPLPGVDVVVTPGMNLGYVGSLEYVRRSFLADYLWPVQDDLTLENDVLGILLDRLNRDTRLAVASPVLVRDGVVPKHSRAGIFADPERTRWTNYPFEDTPVGEIDATRDWCFVSGSGALYRASALEEVGGYDLDLYPLTNVDVDVSLRLRQRGHTLALVPEARISHEVRGSTPKLLANVLYRRHTPLVQAKLERGFADLPMLPASVPPVPEEIRDAVARRASHLFIEVAREADARIVSLNAQIAELRSQNLDLKRKNQDLREQNRTLRRGFASRTKMMVSRLTAPLRRVTRTMRKKRRTS
jgi:GT2 family glycosyltransferase